MVLSTFQSSTDTDSLLDRVISMTVCAFEVSKVYSDPMFLILKWYVAINLSNFSPRLLVSGPKLLGWQLVSMHSSRAVPLVCVYSRSLCSHGGVTVSSFMSR